MGDLKSEGEVDTVMWLIHSSAEYVSTHGVEVGSETQPVTVPVAQVWDSVTKSVKVHMACGSGVQWAILWMLPKQCHCFNMLGSDHHRQDGTDPGHAVLPVTYLVHSKHSINSQYMNR